MNAESIRSMGKELVQSAAANEYVSVKDLLYMKPPKEVLNYQNNVRIYLNISILNIQFLQVIF
jgi:hypothetical protein